MRDHRPLLRRWNRHDDAAEVAACFAAGGRYGDPLTRVDLSGNDLADHVQSVFHVMRDFRISLIRTLDDGSGTCTRPADADLVTRQKYEMTCDVPSSSDESFARQAAVRQAFR